MSGDFQEGVRTVSELTANVGVELGIAFATVRKDVPLGLNLPEAEC
jgi:hypothetical protein